jgi:hypothetical protein
VAERPQPPGKVPLRRNGNWRKQWRYLAAFADELMVCAAKVQVGPLGQTFWAIWDRERRELHERTRMVVPLIARGEVWTELDEGEHTGTVDWAPEQGRTLVRIEAAAKAPEAEPIRAFLHAGEGGWHQAVCETGERDGYVWTRKRPVTVECDVRIGERRVRCEARGMEDESCGYHPSHTVWDWSAGVGETADGRAVAWNLVSGINDPPQGSERAVWIDGTPAEVGPASFDGLDAIDVDGARLVFTAEAERSKEESKPWARYTYRQPFGVFSGTLPGGLVLARGLGVMEHHDAHW